MRALLLTALLLSGGFCTMASAKDSTTIYHPVGMWAWDFWFAKQGDTYHAFYLEAPYCLGDPALKHSHQYVGHATSIDLKHWQDCGPAVVPIHNTWNDLAIATGSVVAYDGRWWMFFTGQGSRGTGIGLAVSEDLMHWRKVGDGPVIPLDKPFPGEWQGAKLQWIGLADPYLYPEPVDGWYYLVLNARVVGAPISESGCLAMMRSRDLQHWEPSAVLAYPRWFERLETPQLWHHGDRWYLYFGGAHDHGIPERIRAEAPEAAKMGTRGNYVFTSSRMEGPFAPAANWVLTLPDGQSGYIMKTVTGPDGRDRLLLAIGDGLSRPYPVEYAADGSLRIGMPE